jgi:Flp pilus assembly protein TadG
MAVILPLLLIMVLGIVEIGRYAYLSILVGNAARAGAAYGAQHLGNSNDTPGIIQAAKNDYLGNGQDPSTLTVTTSPSCGCDDGAGNVTPDTNAACFPANPSLGTCSSGEHWVVNVSVTASATYQGLFGYPGIPSSISVTKTAKMRAANN